MHPTPHTLARHMLMITRLLRQGNVPLLVQLPEVKLSTCYLHRAAHDQFKRYHIHHNCCSYRYDGAFRSGLTSFKCLRKVGNSHSAFCCNKGGCTAMLTCRWLCDFGDKSGSIQQSRQSAEGKLPGDDDLAAVAQDVLDVTRQQNVMASALPLQTVVNLLQNFKTINFPLLPCVRLLSGRLWLLEEPQAVISIAEIIAQHGFHHEVTLNLLKNLPTLYCTQEKPLAEIPDIITSSLVQLRGLGFSGKTLSQLVSRSPQVLFTDPKTLRSVFTRLKGLFTAADAVKVAATCPNVFYQPWKETNWLFDYAFFTMGYMQPQIVKSEVLACPWDKLRDRHVFLMRAGLFARVKAKDDPRLNPNPPLQFVVNASDAVFASKFGKISLEEYNAYLAMRELEREEEENEVDMIDSDSDSSDSDHNDVKNYKVEHKFKKPKG